MLLLVYLNQLIKDISRFDVELFFGFLFQTVEVPVLRYPYRKIFRQIGRIDGEEPDAFIQRIHRIGCFLQDTGVEPEPADIPVDQDRKSTRLNSSHVAISY